MKVLLDTNVISELIAKQPNPQVVEWIDSLDPDSIYLSVVTVGEIRKGIAKLPASQRKDSLTSWLMSDLLIRFDGHILPLDSDVLLAWGQIVGELAAQGINLPVFDSLIGVTAVHHRCSLATRNAADFQHLGVPVINPWQ